jgi:PAS domain S-box-containing protein
MSETADREHKKTSMRDIILGLHQGLPLEKAKEKFEREVGTVSSTEIAEIEQSLIDEGLSPEEIKKFCNVHALLFQGSLEKAAAEETSPSHPIYLFKLENRQIEKILANLKALSSKQKEYDVEQFKSKLIELLTRLRGAETHYERKEQVLFPFLEKHGFMGPSKVMWGKDNEIRDLLKKVLSEMGTVKEEGMEVFLKGRLDPLIEETEGMIFKEENILFPTCLEKLTASEWVEILKESEQVGYVFIERPRETESMIRELKHALLEEPVVREGAVSFPTGTLKLDELMQMLNMLPVDITFVDQEDRVRFFSEGKNRIFMRTRSVIGREVQNCHPPQSVDVVKKILSSLKEGTKDSFDFWINYRGRFIYIRYFAVRDRDGKYLGTLEVTQDLTEIKKLEGEKRLLDERA